MSAPPHSHLGQAASCVICFNNVGHLRALDSSGQPEDPTPCGVDSMLRNDTGMGRDLPLA